jgi:2-polyprenyl-3-methyl-5-hydroxy-6-metoxy-1,4-benzoquinol methylase
MSVSAEKVREDFDRIARVTAETADHLALYDAFLLRQIPRACARVLEIGCGTGAFSRTLADRGHDVTAIDLSPEMVRVAERRRSPGQTATYYCGDFLSFVPCAEAYDCVVSVAALHHMPLEPAVARMAGLVRPGGVLVVHDVRSDAGVGDRLRSALGLVARAWARARAGRIRERAAVRAAWEEHGRGERYLTMPEVEAWSRAHVPGARTIRHLQWRYTVVWRKPDAA